jgi:REP element-mobilizing transposase RayT
MGAKFVLEFHLILIPHYRRAVMGPLDVAFVVENALRGVTITQLGGVATIPTMKVMPDHVHMVLELHRTDFAPAVVVQKLKSYSSKIIRDACPEMKELVHPDSFWSGGYFLRTIGSGKSKKAVERYILENHLKQDNEPKKGGDMKPK